MNPSLTTHVLDATCGSPAAGMSLVLTRLEGDHPGLLTMLDTNTDGTTNHPLLSGPDLKPGRYELTFGVGEYFDDHSGSEPFLDVVPIRFGIGSDAGHLHIVLLATPWSYTTYRGS